MSPDGTEWAEASDVKALASEDNTSGLNSTTSYKKERTVATKTSHGSTNGLRSQLGPQDFTKSRDEQDNAIPV